MFGNKETVKICVQSNFRLSPPLIIDHLSLSDLEQVIFPPRPIFQNAKSFSVKSLYLEPLVTNHLS